MIIAPKLSDDYPKIAEWIEANLPKVRKNPKVFKAFQKYAGFDEEIAERAIKGGNPPIIEWRRLDSANGEFRNKYPGSVFIAQVICRRFADDFADKRMHLLVESTLLHEIVHWGFYNKDRDAREPQELGKAFEKEAYGLDVGRYW